MRFLKFKSDQYVWVNIGDYAIDWDKKVGSKFQFAVKQFFRPYWKTHIMLEEFRIPGSLLRCDLVNMTLRIIIEADGVQHEKFVPHFHNNSRLSYLNSIKRDVAKTEWLEKNNFRLITLYPKDMPLTKNFILDKFDIKLG